MDLDSIDNEKQIAFTWVGDISSCIVEHLQDNRASNEIFNIGTPEKHSVRELVAQLMDTHIYSNSYKYEEDKSLEKINRILGWTADTLFEDCVRKFKAYKK